MGESFQRLLAIAEPEVLSLRAQAALGSMRKPERSQFSHLLRHFLERFFNHESASPDGDAKARLILIAFVTGLPSFVVALYLWPDYHSFIPYVRNHRVVWVPGPPPYWVQVNQHFFFVMYSFVALGIATIFEWDLFFPDLLDLLVLSTLPIPDRRLFYARVAAIAILIGAFLFDANLLAGVVLPESVEPPNLARFLAGHILAVLASGLFAGAFVLAIQGILLAVLGERLFRRLSLALQGLGIASLLLLLFLFPVLSGVVPTLLKSGSGLVLCFPPFWFLGIYERLMEGPAALPIFGRLAQIGCAALPGAVGLAMLAYPLAYLRKVRQIMVGAPTHAGRRRILRWGNWLVNAALVRPPLRRAVFHFIGQTLLRVPRYRIYLVLYGGVGLSVVIASILRLTVVDGVVHAEISADGMRAALGIVAFWMIAGMRMAFVSPGNQQGSWVFRVVHGRPPHFSAAMQLLLAAKVWVLVWAGAVTGGALVLFHAIAPPELQGWRSMAAQAVVGGGMCLLLTDLLFLNVTVVAFTGHPAREQSNLAISILKYIAFVPFAASLPVVAEPLIEMSLGHFAVAITAVAGAHFALRARHRAIVREYSNLIDLEEGEEEFPMKLGLRY
jgi:hypothetical protein